jgi:hypothetical protein
MKTIGTHFRKIQQEHPEWGDYVVLIEAIRGKKFSRKAIRLFFNEFIDSEDYDRADVMELINQLHLASNIAEDGQFGVKIAIFSPLNLKEDVRHQVSQMK